jgi:outer membrane receptor protein involved in Fe transport
MRRLAIVERSTLLAALSPLPGLSFAASDDASTIIDEVIVTATRRALPRASTPMSVSVIGTGQVERLGLHDIDDLYVHVPGLIFTNDGFAGHRISLRGINSGSLTEPRPLTAFYVDDTPLLTLAGSAAQQTFGGARVQALDLARIEVLRGPQGTLFGSSAMGGAVRMITNAPDPTRTLARASVAYESVDRGESGMEATAIFNTPLGGEAAALRVAGVYRVDPGFIDNLARSDRDVDRSEISGGRASVLWHATETLTVRASAHAQNRTLGGMRAADVAAGPYEQLRYHQEWDDERWRLYDMSLTREFPTAQLYVTASRLEREPRFAFDITSFVEGVLGVFVPTANVISDEVGQTVIEARLTS